MSKNTWMKLPETAVTGRKLQAHLATAWKSDPERLKDMVVSMLRMRRETAEPGENIRDGQWPIDEKLMGPTRIPVREIEQAAMKAYHELTGRLLELPEHLRP